MEGRCRKMIFRWSIVTGGLIALFWFVWYLVHGQVPVVASIKITEEWVYELPFEMSRWWDFLIGPIGTTVIIFLLTFRWLRENKNFFGEPFDGVGGIASGMIVGFIFGFAFISALNFGLALTMFLGLIGGLLLGLTSRLVAGLFTGAIVSFFFGFSIGLTKGLLVGVVFGFGFVLSVTLGASLVALFKLLITRLRKRVWGWLMAK